MQRGGRRRPRLKQPKGDIIKMGPGLKPDPISALSGLSVPSGLVVRNYRGAHGGPVINPLGFRNWHVNAAV